MKKCIKIINKKYKEVKMNKQILKQKFKKRESKKVRKNQIIIIKKEKNI